MSVRTRQIRIGVRTSCIGRWVKPLEVVKPITQERKDELCDTDTTTGQGESVKNAQRGRGDHLSTIQIMSAIENMMIMMTIKS